MYACDSMYGEGSALRVGQQFMERQDRGVNMLPVAPKAQVGHVTGYVGFIGEQPVKVGSYREQNAIADHLVDTSWEVIENDTMPIRGVARAKLGRRIRVPFRHRYLDRETRYLDMRMAPREMMPEMCDILLGAEV